jgi:YidC/Oxa1 family membrane protein insertase
MFEFFITRPLGWIIQVIYNLVANYGLAIILFTIVVKLILLPLNIRSQKAMRKTQKIQPLLAEIQQKYANDKEKLQREMTKLYRENNVSMTGGCLPMLIQFPILIGLYQVIQKPLSFIIGVDWSLESVTNEIYRLRDAVGSIAGNLAGQTADVIQKSGQLQLSQWAQKVGTNGTLLDGVSGGAHPWALNFNFLGLDISQTPSKAFSQIFSGNFTNISVIALLLIPILAVVASIISMKITQAQSGQINNQAAQSTKMMNYIMPLMTAFFTVTLPAGLGLYWIISSVVQITQQLAINHYLERKGEDIVVKIPEKKYNHGKKRKK